MRTGRYESVWLVGNSKSYEAYLHMFVLSQRYKPGHFRVIDNNPGDNTG